MTLDRWQQIDELFHSALERQGGHRLAFLAGACADDETLRREVESLLEFHEGAGNFLEVPVGDVAAELLGAGQSGLGPGQMVGPYRIAGLLAAGGMGEVYLADDTRLNRKTALKLLPPQFTRNADRVRRFEQEAHAASALSHPNIVTIYEIGLSNSSHYIATEFIDGETLRQSMAGRALTPCEALDIAAQIASALAAAHEAGVVHRDIKPENIMLRRDRIVKVLDFGLAKLASHGAPAADTRAPGKAALGTEPGMVMGTAHYMSPEQARGVEVDARTDVWSLGVVLYEMAAGRPPFEGETPTEVIARVIEREPVPLAHHVPDLPAELERIVARALVKDLGARYQSSNEMLLDLRALRQKLEFERELDRAVAPAMKTGGQTPDETVKGSSPRTAETTAAHPTSGAGHLVGEIKRHGRGAALAAAAAVVTITAIASFFYSAGSGGLVKGGEAIDSVAVMPFVNAGGDPDTEYLSDGISDAIINSLSRLPDLKVISFNAVLRYKGKQVDPQAVGRDLNVRAVLLGRLVQRGDGLSISTELVDVRDNRRLWGEQYSRRMTDILAVQGEIAREIAGRLRPRLTGEEQKQLAKRYTDNTKAYELYTLGMYHLRKETKEDFDKGIDYFERAIKIDPNYALAYAGLARAYSTLGQRGFWYPKEAQRKAEWAALKAVEIDDTLAVAHSMLGYIKKSNWDWAGAEKELKRALELDRNDAVANFLYSVYLMQLGRTGEALVYAERADEVEGEFPSSVRAFAYLYAHEYDKAIELHLKGSRNRPPGNFQLAQCYLGKGMYDEAVAEAQKVVARDSAPEKYQGYPLLAYAYAAAGRRDEAMKILNEQKELARRGYISPYNFAVIYTGLGDKGRAFEHLNKAYEEGSQMMPHFPRQPLFDSLHSDPRYTELLRKMNLAP